VLAAIPPLGPGRPHGGDLQEPRHAFSLNIALRYMTAASMATQRAQRAFVQHRKAKYDGLILPAPPEIAERPANQNCTNESTPEPDGPGTLPAPGGAAAPDAPRNARTNWRSHALPPGPVAAPCHPIRAIPRLSDRRSTDGAA
jgi:hypothetical protein